MTSDFGSKGTNKGTLTLFAFFVSASTRRFLLISGFVIDVKINREPHLQKNSDLSTIGQTKQI